MANDSIDKLEIEISASSVDAAKQVNELTDAMNRLKKSLGGTWKNPVPKVSSAAKQSNAPKKSNIEPKNSEIETASADTAAEKVERLVREKEKLKTPTKIQIDSKDADKANGKLAKLWESLKRIAFYRAIRSALKAVAAAFREGLENAYEYSRLVGGELAPALDRIASASLQAKNQLGAAWGGVLQALEPIIVQILHLVTKLAQAFTWLFAVLGGKDTYLVANETATAWKKATGAAKEYQKTLLGIDEINRLNGAGGGGASTPDYASMFHEEPTNFKLPDLKAWAIPIKEKIQEIIDKVKELVRWLKSLPSPSVVIHLALEWAKEKLGDVIGQLEWVTGKSPWLVTLGVLVPSLEPVHEFAYALETVLAKSPYLVTVEALVPDFAFETVAALKSALETVLAKSPYILTLALALQGEPIAVMESVGAAVKALESTFALSYQSIMETVDAWVADYLEAANNAKQYAKETGTSVRDLRKNAETDFSAFQEALEKFKDKYNQVKTSVIEYTRMLDGKLEQYIRQGESRIKTFTDNVKQTWNQWAPQFGALVTTAFLQLATNMSPGIAGAQRNLANFLTNAFTNFKSWGTAISGVFDAIWQKISNVVSGIKTVISNITSSSAWQYIFGSGNSYSNIPSMPTIPAIPAFPAFVPVFANGGFPEDGLFFANRNELIGQFSNGRTAVTNNQQITEGIADAVYRAFMEAFASTGGNSENGAEVNVYIGNEKIYSGFEKYSRQRDRAMGR